MTANALTVAGVSLADLQGDIRSSDLTSASTGTDINDWIVSVAGFGETVTFADLQTAITNGWTTANYLAATTGGTSSVSGLDWQSASVNVGGTTPTTIQVRHFAERGGDFHPNWGGVTAFAVETTSNNLLYEPDTPNVMAAIPVGSIIRVGGNNQQIFEVTGSRNSGLSGRVSMVTLNLVTTASLNALQSGVGDYLSSIGVTAFETRRGSPDNNYNGYDGQDIEKLASPQIGRGWTNSSSDRLAFSDCLTSTDSLTGGSASCTTSKSQWNSVSEVTTITDATQLQPEDIENVIELATGGGSGNLDVSGNPAHLDYIRSCIDRLTTITSAGVASCATDSNALSNASSYAFANWSSDYTLDQSVMTSVGISASNATLFSDDTSNSCFGDTCANVIASYLANNSDNYTLTTSSSSADILTVLNSAFDHHYTIKANEVPAVTQSNAPQGNSCAVTTAPAPSLCSHQPNSHIYCTVHTTNFSINDPLYNTISYNGATSAISSNTNKEYTLKYHSRRTNTVIRTETRMLRILVANNNQTTARQVIQGARSCWQANNNCTSQGGTVATKAQSEAHNDIGWNDLFYANGTSYYMQYSNCNNGYGPLQGCEYGCGSFTNLKVVCNMPVCN